LRDQTPLIKRSIGRRRTRQARNVPDVKRLDPNVLAGQCERFDRHPPSIILEQMNPAGAINFERKFERQQEHRLWI
jgi:hypothetical protein